MSKMLRGKIWCKRGGMLKIFFLPKGGRGRSESIFSQETIPWGTKPGYNFCGLLFFKKLTVFSLIVESVTSKPWQSANYFSCH